MTPDRVVVLVGADAEALGTAAHDLRVAGLRAAVFVGDPTDATARAALLEMVRELFPEPD